MLEGMLLRDEAKKLFVYDDATGEPLKPGMTLKGHPTIGIGRALDTHGISSAEADYLVTSDIYQVEQEAEKAFPWYPALTDERKAVILSMLFQLGLAGVQGFHEFLLAVEHQNWARAASEMVNSLWARETPARAKRLADQMETGVLQ
jgi:lysozyme